VMFGDIKVFTYGVNKYKTEDVFIFMDNNPWVFMGKPIFKDNPLRC